MANRITRRWRRITITGAALAVAVLGMAVSTSAASSDQSRDGTEGPAQASSGTPGPSPTGVLADCEVELELEYGFDTGSIYMLTVTAGDDTVQGWYASWIWPDDTEITHVFDVEGLPEQNGRLVEVTAHPQYGYIEPGESKSFAFLVDTPWLYNAPEIDSHCYVYLP
ncbi:hypothetical protein [Glycomyces xiaoerkulensis]|uniref:hypothetical protein n=1 Tax=Glycomyces xiaoerkulensis TaxID=2038139 RepID=UPI000C25C931|nr:hypothetical protein [Glycomyces xiaoerkulensis]